MDRLEQYYGVGQWKIPHLNARHPDPFQVLVSTILSQRTRDEVTYVVADQLLLPHPTPQAIAQMRVREIEKIIRPVGFPQAKARAISELSHILLRDYQGTVPSDMDLLLQLPMVGRKTAGCVLVYGFDQPALPVDTHVHRISNRFGAVKTRHPEETEEALMASMPKELWKRVNPVLVQHGQNLCRPIHPLCPECPIREFCALGRKEQSLPKPRSRRSVSRRK